MMKAFDRNTTKMISETHDALGAMLEAAREYYDGRAERWQESDAGTDYAAWIDEIEAVYDALGELSTEAPATAKVGG